MNTEENKFPEISGIELHYNSVNGLNVQNPNKIFDKGASQEVSYMPKATSDSTGSGENGVPGVSESPGASSINGMFPGGMIREEVSFEQLIDKHTSEALSKFQADFEYQLMFGTAEPKEVNGDWFDLTMKGKDLEFWEQLKIMPKFMILEMIVDPETEYKFTIISEKGKNRVKYVLGKDLSSVEQDIIIERYTKAVSEKIFGTDDKEAIQEIIDAQKLENDLKAFGKFKNSMGVFESKKDAQVSYQGIFVTDPSTYIGGIDPVH